MTLLIVLLTAIVVWLNRGIYDPSVPVLVACFLFWTYETLRMRDPLRRLHQYLFLLPWIFAILFIFRNDLLYVDEPKKAVLQWIRFLPLLAVAADAFTLRKVSLGILFALLLCVPFLSPEPHIDVFQSNRLAVHFFLHGANPYSSIYPDIYQNQYDYHPGFLYWPGALLLQSLSEVIFKDIRFVLILAWMGAAFLLKTKKQYLLVWLTLPFLDFAFEQAWLDPLIALGGALALYGLRKQKHLWWTLGVVLAASVKQYGFMIGLFSMLYFARTKGVRASWKPVLKMSALFLLLLMPFVIWDPHAFLQMTVLTHATAKIRPDALNFTAFWLKLSGQEFSNAAQLGFILMGMGLAAFHVVRNSSRRSLRVIPEAWAMFFGFSIFFGKFAFCNYFLLLISFWLMAESEGDEPPSSAQINLQMST